MTKQIYTRALSKINSGSKVLACALLFLLLSSHLRAQTYTNFQVAVLSGQPGCASCGCTGCSGNNTFWITDVTINGPTPLAFHGGTGVASLPDANHSQRDLTGNSSYNNGTVVAGLS